MESSQKIVVVNVEVGVVNKVNREYPKCTNFCEAKFLKSLNSQK